MLQALRDLAVQRDDPFPHIDDQDDDRGGVNGQLHLLDGRLRDEGLRLFPPRQSDAAGIHEGKDAPMPFGLGGDAVARDPGFVVDNGDALSDDAIKQRGFTDVGPSHNGD
jgi:hypothetical protein